MKKTILLWTIISVLGFVLFNFKNTGAQELKCPPKTSVSYRFINFVGKAGLGNDKKINVWFEYGDSENSLNYKTKVLTLYQEGIFCIKETKNIKPCTNYYYRAAAQNSAGINYGEIKNIKTLCLNKAFQNKLKNLKWVIF